MASLADHGQLRVFVSSTFQDMAAERNVLVSRVFPRVREYCRGKRIEFTGVDLRWGVTEEQALAGETVSICMAEIDRCRPLFLGMLGERYGWVPDGAAVSVTEQEMEYGAFEAPEGTRAFFCLRAPALTSSLSFPVTPDERLDKLRERIRKSGFPVLDNYGSLEEFEEGVYAFLTDAADALAPALLEADAVEKQRREQWFLAAHNAMYFAGRKQALAKLDAAAEKGGLILLTGAPGTGKQTLLSRWALTKKTGNAYVFLFFAGSAQGGWETAAGQLLHELTRRFLPGCPVPADAEGIRRGLSIVLNLVSKRNGRVLIIIDRAPLLLKNDGYGFSWLPRELPAGVTAVLSADEGEALETLRQRPHTEIRLERFTPGEIAEAATEYLGHYAKTLSREQTALLSASEEARTPLYLITLLNEIRQRGRFETLTDEMRECLACSDTQSLLIRVLSRLEREYGSGRAEKLLLYLEAAPDGLTEGELALLHGDMPGAEFYPLFLELRPFTALKNGAFFPGSAVFWETVRKRYEVTKTSLLRIRKELADWFTQNTELVRRTLVLPALYALTEDTASLYSLLITPDGFLTAWEKSREETKEHWRRLIGAGCSPSEGYAGFLTDEKEASPAFLTALAEFLSETGFGAQAMPLLHRLTEERQSVETRMKAAGLAGNLLSQAGKLPEAESAYRLRYRLANLTGDRYEQQRALGNIGILRQRQGDNAAARDAFETVFALAEKLNQSDAVQIALGNLGNVAFSMGDAGEAERLYRKQQAVCLDTGNVPGRIASLGALGILCCRRRAFDEAEKAFREQYEESLRIQAYDGTANALGNLAALSAMRGGFAEAERKYEEKLRLCRQTGQFPGEQNALLNLAKLASNRGAHEEALAYAHERTELTRKSRAFRQYAQSLLIEAQEKEALQLKEEAGALRLQADAIARQHGFTELFQGGK